MTNGEYSYCVGVGGLTSRQLGVGQVRRWRYVSVWSVTCIGLSFIKRKMGMVSVLGMS